jgi:hypothetical protein
MLVPIFKYFAIGHASRYVCMSEQLNLTSCWFLLYTHHSFVRIHFFLFIYDLRAHSVSADSVLSIVPNITQYAKLKPYKLVNNNYIYTS